MNLVSGWTVSIDSSQFRMRFRRLIEPSWANLSAVYHQCRTSHKHDPSLLGVVLLVKKNPKSSC